MLTPENTAAFAIETGGYFPVRKSAFASDQYQEYLKNPADEKKAYAQAALVAQNSIFLNTYLLTCSSVPQISALK